MTNESSYSPLMQHEGNQENKGVLFIVIALIILMLIGGLFIIKSKETSNEEVTTSTATALEEKNLATSTALDDINRDINEVEASVLNSELDQLDQEIKNLE